MNKSKHMYVVRDIHRTGKLRKTICHIVICALYEDEMGGACCTDKRVF